MTPLLPLEGWPVSVQLTSFSFTNGSGQLLTELC